jgi:GNAT superfamily N-acetyltransferase
MKTSYRYTTIKEMEACENIHDLLHEYSEESSVRGLPTPNAKAELYKSIEDTGALQTIGAFVDDKLIGFIVILSPIIPHYGALVCVVESFFVTKPYRKSGAGIRLLRMAEDFAKSKGSPGLLVSAPINGSLCDVLPHVGYTESNRVFFRKLDDDQSPLHTANE